MCKMSMKRTSLNTLYYNHNNISKYDVEGQTGFCNIPSNATSQTYNFLSLYINFIILNLFLLELNVALAYTSLCPCSNCIFKCL